DANDYGVDKPRQKSLTKPGVLSSLAHWLHHCSGHNGLLLTELETRRNVPRIHSMVNKKGSPRTTKTYRSADYWIKLFGYSAAIEALKAFAMSLAFLRSSLPVPR